MMNSKQKKVLIRILISAFILLTLAIVPLPDPRMKYLYLIPYLVIGYDILKKAIKGIANRQVFDENFLMAVATVGAIALGEYTEGCAVMLFYQIGELFQSIAVGKSRQSIAELMDIRPDYANLETEDGIEVVDPEDVPAGSILVVKPGEKIPIDGRIIEGSTTLNTSALTGESLPRDASVGEEVLSGCVNMSAVIRLETTRDFEESTASKILDMVENASSRKSRSEQFITKFARYYTPAVCYGALALAILPPLFRTGLLHLDPQWSVWVYRALTFLVISCPCALVISIPLSFFAGIGGASREGILVKGSNYLEALSKVKTVVFDKTGTMTQGVFEVTGIHHSSMETEKLLEYAALAECYSTHPISLSLQKAYGKEIDESRVSNVQEHSGAGITALVDGIPVAAGNARLMKQLGIDYTECRSIGTIVHMAVEGRYAGHILIADVIKPQAGEAISALKRAGISKTVMLTGDSERVAAEVGSTLGIDEIHAQLMPGDKVQLVEKMLGQQPAGAKLAFAGDGINDAPVLARADVGIAMGALGSDAAIEAADIVLMDDDPRSIAKAIRISRKCLRIVYENIYFAIGVKLLCLLLSAFGITNMWAAIFADVGVMVIAVCNAIRVLRPDR